MISAYLLAGELAAAQGDTSRHLPDTKRCCGATSTQSSSAPRARFAGAFAPKTRAGLHFRNLIIKAFAIPGVAKLAVGRDIADSLRLPDYGWSALKELAVA